MIRPFTCLAFLLACGSGLYLYQSKHRASLLDAKIAQTVRSTDVLREQTRMLSAEWTLLNDPERLRQLANQFLTLQTVSPNQFTSLGDLDGRLPAPVAPGAPDNGGNGTPAQVAADDAGRPATDEGKPAEAKLAEASPRLPVVQTPSGAGPQATKVVVSASAEQSHPPEARPAAMRVATVVAQPRPTIVQPRPPEQRGSEQRGYEQRGYEQRLAEARPVAQPLRMPAPLSRPAAFQAGGSLLGMAHDMAAPPQPMPLPRPMPVSAPNWSYSGTGG